MEVSEFSVQSSTVNFRGNGSLSKLKALTDGNTSTAPLFNFYLADVILEKFFELQKPMRLSSYQCLVDWTLTQDT